MQNPNIEHWTVNEVAANIDGAKDVLYNHNVSATNRLTLANAAAAASVTTDELLATMNHRMRRAARTRTVTKEEEVVA